jgi:2'-5' RNA ligase
MKQTIRTFVAVEISSAVRHCAAELIDQLRAAPVDVKWVEPDNIHLTLKFLGDVDSRKVHEVCRAVEQAADGLAPFELEVRGAGAFPNLRRPRTLWLGAGQGGREVGVLAERVESKLHKLGYRREGRRFHAHLTLGRVRRGGPGIAQLGQLLEEYADFEIGRTPVSDVIVFSSTLGRGGPTYEPLGRAALRGA